MVIKEYYKNKETEKAEDVKAKKQKRYNKLLMP
jgi:hypothetical protein